MWVLQNTVGNTVMAGVKEGEDFNSGAIPHATPPKYGLMDPHGKVLVEPKWDEIRILSPQWVWIGMGGKCGIANVKGNVVLEPVWDEVRAISPEWLWFRKGAKCGLADASGKVIVEPEFHEAEVLRVRSASMAEDEGRLLLGPQGKPIHAPWIRIRDRDGYRILRSNGQSAIPPELANADFIDFYGPKHVAVVEPGDNGLPLWSLYNPSTNTKTTFQNAERLFWNWSMSLSGLLWIQDKADSKWKLMGSDGKDLGHVQDHKPDEWELRDGLGMLQDANGWFFINVKGERIGGTTWTHARPFQEGRAAVEKNGKWGFIDTTGNVIAEPAWVEVGDFDMGLAAVKAESGWWGFVGLDGKVVAQPVWDEIGKLSRIGYYDPTGRVRRQIQVRDVVLVRYNGYWGCIDRTGKLLVVPKHQHWDALEWFVEGYSVFKASKWFDPDYDYGRLDAFSGGLISTRTKERKYGLIRMDDVQVIPSVYDRIAWVAPGVAAAWSQADGGLLERGGQWIFRDNDKIRVARFGDRDARVTDAQYRHGLVVIEDSPKWGYARLKR